METVFAIIGYVLGCAVTAMLLISQSPGNVKDENGNSQIKTEELIESTLYVVLVTPIGALLIDYFKSKRNRS